MRFLNFVRAWFRFKWYKARGFEPIASPAVAQGRFNWCQQCPSFNGAECEKCGCLAMAKTLINFETCPGGYWHPIFRKKLTPPHARETTF